VSLLLLDRAKQGEITVRPRPGEQYRFHFDMTKCIGCRCCEVACAEQNGNPLPINWRRVGEIEGGTYPFAQRFYLSMGCNHCLEPSCLSGCPVNAYAKESVTGLVLHSAEACIGCGYCTWNCPYGVPQYNPDRGVVGKCDMCFGRLAQDRQPACTEACPENAIEIELVNIAEWRADHESANAPGMPSADHTISTTRITLPEKISPALERADYHRVRPEDPHLPLVAMLVLTQLSAGAFFWLALLRAAHQAAVAASLIVAFLSLAASTLHLGRPIYAFRALRMWRRSWLSREVLLFSLFAGAAAASVALPSLIPVAALLGFAGVTASAFIYLVPARPAWNSKSTLADFYLTALLLGPLFLATLGVEAPALPVCAAAALQLLNCLLKFTVMSASDEFELRASARLLGHDLRGAFLMRLSLLLVGGIVLPLTGHAAYGFGVTLAAELLSRYLFFVSVVPKNMAASFFRKEAA
jgi:formate dehydrogenase iron-sulfur subunit